MARWLARRRGSVALVPTFTTAVLFQGVGHRQV